MRRNVLRAVPGLCALTGGWASAAVVDLTPVASADIKVVTTGTPAVETGNLNLKNASTSGIGNTRKGYLRFDFTGVTVSNITNATLTLSLASDSTGHTAASTTTVNLSGVKDVATPNASFTGTAPSSHTVFGDDVAWTAAAGVAATDLAISGTSTAGTLTNAMAATNTSGSYYANAGFSPTFATTIASQALTVDSTGKVASGTTVTYTDAALKNFLITDSNGIVTLLLAMGTTDTNGGTYVFDSAASAGHVVPTLELTLADPGTPEPAALGLLGVAGGGLLRRRRSPALRCSC